MPTKTATEKSQDLVGDVGAFAPTGSQSSRSNGSSGSPPEVTFRVGRVSASVFINSAQLAGKSGDYTRRFRTVTLQRSYKADDGSTQYASSYGLGEIRNAIRVLELAALHLEAKEVKVAD